MERSSRLCLHSFPGNESHALFSTYLSVSSIVTRSLPRAKITTDSRTRSAPEPGLIGPGLVVVKVWCSLILGWSVFVNFICVCVCLITISRESMSVSVSRVRVCIYYTVQYVHPHIHTHTHIQTQMSGCVWACVGGGEVWVCVRVRDRDSQRVMNKKTERVREWRGR